MDYGILKKRYVGLDVFRVISALTVWAFHTIMHLNAYWGVFQRMFRMGAVFMTAFFMLSGYSLFVNYAGNDLVQLPNLKRFWIKRITGVIPLYYFAAILFVLTQTKTQEVAVQELLLFPVELLCMQSSFTTLFAYSHNGLTWFVACIMVCYLVYPLLQEIAKQISVKTKVILLLVCSFAVLYAPIVVNRFGLGIIYHNNFFRMLEFFIGVLLASLKPQLDESRFVQKVIYRWSTMIAALLLMGLGVTLAMRAEWHSGDNQMYNWICLPFFFVLLIGFSGVKSERLSKSKLLAYCSGASYAFYLSQLFYDKVCKWAIARYAIVSNRKVILLAALVCVVITVLFHELIEHPVGAFLNKKWLKREASN